MYHAHGPNSREQIDREYVLARQGWMISPVCASAGHINHHTMNDNREERGAGGLNLILEVG